jgi:penicillin-binding protein 1C
LRRPENIDPALAGLEGVAWKTGTSNGLRDAWTIAYDRDRTVGVWLGNFDGRPSHALVGSQAAAPVALKLIEQLRSRHNAETNWPARPDAELRKIVVCAESGYPASDDCPTTRVVDAPAYRERTAGRSGAVLESAPICSIHKKIRVDSRSGEQLCTRCLPGHDATERVFAFWPGSVASWLATNGGNSALPPPHCHDCPSISRGPELRITSPQAGDSFLLTAGRSAEAQKVSLEAAAPPASRKLYWFLDGELVQAADRTSAAYLPPTEGTHRLRCVDEAGHADWVTFSVRKEQ